MLKLSTAICYLLLVFCSLNAQEINSAVGEDLQPQVANNTSTNETHKIQVRGQNTQLRMAISAIANSMASDLADLIKTPDEYQGSRTVYIEIPEKGKSSGNLQVLPKVTPFDDADLIIKLLVNSSKKIDRDVLAHGIIEVLLYRNGLEGVNNLDPSQEAYVPAWVSHGLIEAMAWKEDSSERKVYEHLLANPEIFPLAKMFGASGRDVNAFDETNKSFFKAASCALVLSMLRQEEAEEGMRAFLTDLVLFEGEIEVLIRKHFGAYAQGTNAIQKIWSLQVAEMAAPKMVETFTISETNKKLSEALVLILPDADGKAQIFPLGQYELLKDLEGIDRVQATDAMRRDVMRLSNRCHPTFRAILYEYIQLSAEISGGDFENIEERLPLLEDERHKMVIADERCRDYLDWYQITRAHSISGDFTGYMKLRETMAIEREHAKDESIDIYMDSMQKLMGTE